MTSPFYEAFPVASNPCCYRELVLVDSEELLGRRKGHRLNPVSILDDAPHLRHVQGKLPWPGVTMPDALAVGLRPFAMNNS